MFEELFQDAGRVLIMMFWFMLAMTVTTGALLTRIIRRS